MKKISLNEEFSMEGNVYTFSSNEGKISLKRLRESKIKVAKSFIPPSLDEFKKYFSDNGYKVDVGERAWRSYDVANWHKSNGEKIFNWKQTCIQVWFKPDNLLIKVPEVGIAFFQNK